MDLERESREGGRSVGSMGGVVLFWVGAALLVWAAGAGVKSWRWLSAGERATATVSENVVRLVDGRSMAYPRFHFRAADGELVTVVSGEGSEAAAFAPGDEVRVRYPAGRPADAVIATTGRVYFWAILAGVAGVLALDVGIGMQIAARRQMRWPGWRRVIWGPRSDG